MGIGERMMQLSKMKSSTIDGCDKCKSFDNAEKTQERLAKIRDFYDELRSSGIIAGSKKDWVEKYSGLIKLCQTCIQKTREREHCSGSIYASELRNILGKTF